MNTIRKNFSWIVLSISIAACSSAGFIRDGYDVIPLHMAGSRIPIVKGKLNDREAWFIVDTGASATVINRSMCKYFGIRDYRNYGSVPTELNGLGGAVALESSTCRIGLGNLTIRHAVLKSSDLNNLFSLISSSEHIAIAGILGSDLLSLYQLNVNYDNLTLSYKIRSGLRLIHP